MITMKMNQNGQVTIPKALRDLLGLEPDTDIQIELSKDGILLKPVLSNAEDVMVWLKKEHGDEMATLTNDQIFHLMH